MHRRPTNVLFVPDWREGNPYMESLSAGLEQEGFHISFDHFPRGYFKLTHLANEYPFVGVIHVHWIPPPFVDQFFWSRSEFKFNVRLLLLALDMLLCRARRIRIVWTLHNLAEHDSPAPDQELRVRALLARLANAVIAHSEEALETAAIGYAVDLSRKGHVIPHGSYIGIYEYSEAIKESLRAKYAIEDSDLVILFFGAVRRYKGLNLLLPAFRAVSNSKIRLIVAGNPLEDEMKQWVIQEAGKDDRVRLSLGFVPEEQVAAHFALADAVVLPFQNTLTSGSAILAMGFGKCLILPESARVLGVSGHAGTLYYEDEAGLGDLLTKLPEMDLRGMGEHNLEVVQRLDWRKIAAATGRVYLGPRERIIWGPQSPEPQE